MTAQRQADGSYRYRGRHIAINPTVRPGKLGRYSVDGVLFAQLGPARAHVDMLSKPDQRQTETTI